VVCSADSQASIDAGNYVVSQLDSTRGSGLITIKSGGNGYGIGSGYISGGGALLRDETTRQEVIDSLILFLEAI